jgi:hypothetical protein
VKWVTLSAGEIPGQIAQIFPASPTLDELLKPHFL